MTYEEKEKIILESFYRNKGHYRKMSEELKIIYGKGFTIGTISNYMKCYLSSKTTPEQEAYNAKKQLLANAYNLKDLDKITNEFYELTKEQQLLIVIELYLNDRTMNQIAKALGVSKDMISRILKSIEKQPDLFALYGSQIEETKNRNRHGRK